MNIPLPSAGHWRKLQFGKKARVVPLPEKYEGDSAVSLTLRSSDNGNSSEPDSRLEEIRNDPRVNLVVPEELRYPDPLIVAAKERLTGKDRITSYRFEGLVSCSRGELDIRVTLNNVPRALRFMDTLIKAINNRGGSIILRNDLTYARVKSQEFRIALREKTKRVVKPGDSWTTYEPLNILYFKFDGYGSQEWKDGKNPLEYYIPNILAKLEKVSDDLTFEQEKHRRHMESIYAEERRLKDAIFRKEKELENFKKLLKDAERWEKAKLLRKYIDVVERKGAGSLASSEEKQNWIAWAHKRADWYDPFIEAEDEILAEIDRTSLTIKTN